MKWKFDLELIMMIIVITKASSYQKEQQGRDAIACAQRQEWRKRKRGRDIERKTEKEENGESAGRLVLKDNNIIYRQSERKDLISPTQQRPFFPKPTSIWVQRLQYVGRLKFLSLHRWLPSSLQFCTKGLGMH